jgi:hypothetical protein
MRKRYFVAKGIKNSLTVRPTPCRRADRGVAGLDQIIAP